MDLLITNFDNIGNALGWALIHFLWQGSLLFITYWSFTRILLRDRINAQYWVGILTITLCLIVPIREFIIQLETINESNIVHQLGLSLIAIESKGILSKTDLFVSLIQKILPYLVILWGAIVFLISTHLIKSWVSLVKLSNDISIKIPENLKNKLEETTELLKLKFTPIITISKKIDIPATFGYFKPVVLLPASLINKLPQDQMEAILLHEICHIKRADFMHNIIQLIVETLFFYHPLTKWISQDIRKVREQCCDELVLRLDAKPLVYANALTNIAEIYNKNYNNQQKSSHLQIAASDGELFNRIKFLMLEKRAKSPLSNLLIGLFLATLLLFVLKNLMNNNQIEQYKTVNNNDSTINSFNSNTVSRPSYYNPSINSIIEKNKPTEKKAKKAVTTQPRKSFEIKNRLNPQAQLIVNTKAEPKLQSKSKIDSDVSLPSTSKLIKQKSSNNELENNKKVQQTIKPKPSETKQKANHFPKVVKRVAPIYPKVARSRGIEGNVILSFNIDYKGRVKNIKVDTSSPLKLLDGSARRALKNWRFDKKSINAQNISNRYQQIFSFNLDNTERCINGDIGSRLNSDKVCHN